MRRDPFPLHFPGCHTLHRIHFLDASSWPLGACGWASVHMSSPTITLPSRQGRPSSPSCLPIFVDHRDGVKTCGRQVDSSSVCDPLFSTTPSYYPTKRESQRVTHRCLALSPLSTYGKTLLKTGQNSRHRASSRRRCCSTNLGRSGPAVSSSVRKLPASPKHGLVLPWP